MAQALQFVVQRHETDQSVHWDLMLEQTETLATWHVPFPPEQIAAQPLAIERIGDHPKRFLAYEGPLRRHPGSVRIHDRGTYTLISQSENAWLVSIAGEALAGTFRLDCIAEPGSAAWRIVRIADG